MKPEAKVVKKVLALLKSRGAKAIKCQPPGVEAGTPDILAVFKGWPLLLECKAPNGKASPLQEHRMKEWAAAGAEVLVVRDVKEVEILLDTLELVV